jgi:thiazole synthase
LVINGREAAIEGARTIGDVLRSRSLKPTLVAVEHNGAIVPRSDFDRHQVGDGDRLEIVHFVGGG